MRLASAGSKASYRDERRRVQIVLTKTSGLCPGSIHQLPHHAGQSTLVRWSAPPPAATPPSANSMNRLLTPLRSYSIVGRGSPRTRRQGGAGAACWSRPGTPDRLELDGTPPARPPWHRRTGIGLGRDAPTSAKVRFFQRLGTVSGLMLSTISHSAGQPAVAASNRHGPPAVRYRRGESGGLPGASSGGG